MTASEIELDFGILLLKAELFDTPVANRFVKILPCEIALVQWGNELYGPIGSDLGAYAPVPDIPPGGIAYTDRGGYLCIFFGQIPAWPVEYIGRIPGDDWRKLLQNPGLDKVTVRACF